MSLKAVKGSSFLLSTLVSGLSKRKLSKLKLNLSLLIADLYLEPLYSGSNISRIFKWLSFWTTDRTSRPKKASNSISVNSEMLKFSLVSFVVFFLIFILVYSTISYFKFAVINKENNSFGSVTFRAAPLEPLWKWTKFLATCPVGLLEGPVGLVNQVCVVFLPYPFRTSRVHSKTWGLLSDLVKHVMGALVDRFFLAGPRLGSVVRLRLVLGLLWLSAVDVDGVCRWSFSLITSSSSSSWPLCLDVFASSFCPAFTTGVSSSPSESEECNCAVRDFNLRWAWDSFSASLSSESSWSECSLAPSGKSSFSLSYIKYFNIW